VVGYFVGCCDEIVGMQVGYNNGMVGMQVGIRYMMVILGWLLKCYGGCVVWLVVMLSSSLCTMQICLCDVLMDNQISLISGWVLGWLV